MAVPKRIKVTGYNEFADSDSKRYLTVGKEYAVTYCEDDAEPYLCEITDNEGDSIRVLVESPAYPCAHGGIYEVVA